MDTPTRIGAFAVGLVAVFGVAAGLGTVVGPVEAAGTDAAPRADGAPRDQDTATTDAGASDRGTEPEEIPGGLMISARGYTLVPAAATLPAGAATPVAFRILGPDGETLSAYDESHDEDLHLIAVRRDMAGFQHVHPEMAADGTWSTPLALEPGEWRLFADFDPAGPEGSLTLGADVSVAGDYAPRPMPEPSTTDEVDGYTVDLDGELVPGRESELTLAVSRDGEPVRDLQPYLAAYGHLVALRDGDLAYLHVHPAGEPGDGRTRPGPDITFYVSVPSGGDYRLFLDFRHGDVVRTAEFTARAGNPGAPAAGTGPAPAEPAPAAGHVEDGHGHGG